MLALKNVFARQERVGTMVFDEVDTGVSGRAAQRVAEKMARVSREKQVLCVTHLPQIAAMADTHFSVEKEEQGGRTYTRVKELDRAERRRQLARLTGGENVTQTPLQGAEELLASLDIRSDEPVYRGLAHLLPFWHGAIGRINQQNANILTESVLLHTLSYLTGKNDGITQKESHENLLSAITDYIHTHFRDSDLSLCKIADIFSYTEKYISFFFKKHMKIGFNSYLNSLRIKYALELMEKNARSVGYIARECGYEDALYFSKVFKKTMACTPTEYMKKVGALPTGDPYMNLLNDLFEDH
jgi:AraC-like DNA-binding protein